MAETTTGATPGADARSEQVQEKPQDQTQSPATGGEAEAQLSEAGREAIRREREAAQAASREAKELRARLKTLEEKDLPDAEKTSRRLAELERTNSDLERQLQELRVRETVIGTASRLGFADPVDAFQLLDTASLEYADDGQPKDIEKALKSLLAAKPYLASSAVRPTGSADAGNLEGRSSGGYNTNDLLRAAARR